MTTAIPGPVVELSAPQVLITRLFNAPRDLVFKAWTDPKQLLQWYAPNGCKLQFRQIDIREGGTFHSCIQTPNGFQCWCTGVYQEIVAPERVVYTMAIADEHGNRIDSTDAGHDPEWPAETITTVTFEVQDGKTKLTLRQNVSECLAIRTGAHPSWIQMLDRLESKLAQDA